MKIEEGQKKQLIVLCCLIALVLGFAVYRVVGTGTQAATAQEQSAQAPVQIGTPEQAAEPQAGGEETTPLVQPQVATARDPFSPQLVPRAVSASCGGTSRPSLQPKLPPLFGNSGRPPIQMIPPLTITDNVGGPSANVMGPVRQPDDDPGRQLKLTGVIEGSINVAIIRGPDNARYIVREGQTIDGRFKVASISRAGVRVVHNSKTFVLRLGGNDATENGAQA